MSYNSKYTGEEVENKLDKITDDVLLEDAEQDGNVYGRKDGAWAKIPKEVYVAEIGFDGGSTTSTVTQTQFDELKAAIIANKSINIAIDLDDVNNYYKYSPAACHMVSNEEDGLQYIELRLFNSEGSSKHQRTTLYVYPDLSVVRDYYIGGFDFPDDDYESAYKRFVDLDTSTNYAYVNAKPLYSYITSISSIGVNSQVYYADISASESLAMSVAGSSYNGYSITVFVYTASSVTITIPTTGNYISMCGSSYTTTAGGWVEFNLTCINGIWHIAKLEQE